MLSILDRYIFRKFLSTFFFTVLIFSLISMVIDFSEKVEDIIEEGISFRDVVLGYYPTFILWMSGLLWPLFTLIAVIFFTSRMAYNSEIISILNAGVSFRRLMRPYLMVSALLAAMLLMGNHYFIPLANAIRLDLTYTYFYQEKKVTSTRDVHMFLSPGNKVFLQSFRVRDSTANKFRIERFEDNQLVYLLEARRAEYLNAEEKWRLHSYEERWFDGLDERMVIGLNKTKDTTLNLSPADFLEEQEQQTTMPTYELRRLIRDKRARGVGNTKNYEIEFHRRTAEAFTIIILTIIGMSIASRKVRGGMGLHLALGIGLGAIYIFLSRFSIVFASGQSLSVVLGIWLPNLVFAGVAVFLVSRAQK